MPISYSLAKKVYPTIEPTQFEPFEILPEPHKPVVTINNVTDGFINRYFTRVANDKNYIVEINQNNYGVFSKNPRYVTTEIVWKIIGKKETIIKPSGVRIPGVEDFNRETVSQADLTFGGLYKYITNYLEYWFAES